MLCVAVMCLAYAAEHAAFLQTLVFACFQIVTVASVAKGLLFDACGFFRCMCV